uniref:Uncharacterized protein n=1 Tax=viral metagenome TaxID=1070528 RepID=A0A6C0I857_9ZZZZ
MSKSNKPVDSSLLGPDYPYYKYIKTPKELGLSTKGDLATVGKDLVGLSQYVEVMVTGKSKASSTGQPLGNKFFLKSGGKCTDVKTGQEVDRFVYINNVPTGNIPFISSGLDVNFSEFRGLIPGTLEQLNNFNPLVLWRAFTAGPKQACQELTMDVIDTYNNKSTETHYVTVVDIKDMDNCIFPGKKPNPITGVPCRETFDNMESLSSSFDTSLVRDFGPSLPSNINSQLYMASVGILGVYVVYKGLQKMKLIPQ